MLFAVTIEKLLAEPIDHIKNISKKKPTTERLLTYTNKSSATNCDEATVEDTLCIPRTKNLIDENVKLLSGNKELVNVEILPTPFTGRPGTPTKDTNKISDIVLNDIKKDLMWHVKSEVENLKALIDKEFTTGKRFIEDLKRKNFIVGNTPLWKKISKKRNK